MALLRVDARPLLPRLRGGGGGGGGELGGRGGGGGGGGPDRTAGGPPACLARTTVDDAVKLYIRDPSAAALTWQGDAEIAAALAGVKAILG